MQLDRPDIRAAAQRAHSRAHHFTTTCFKNGGYLTIRSKTLSEARAARPGLERQAANGRKALIYAVSPEAMTDLIPDWFEPAQTVHELFSNMDDAGHAAISNMLGDMPRMGDDATSESLAKAVAAGGLLGPDDAAKLAHHVVYDRRRQNMPQNMQQGERGQAAEAAADALQEAADTVDEITGKLGEARDGQ